MFSKPVLVTGATGYVGGRLIPLMLESGYRVRALARSLAKLRSRPWSGHINIELVQGDVLDLASLNKAASGCGAAYYLVHSMVAQKRHYAEADRKSALNMAAAAAAAGLERIIYLSGLGESQSTALSKHLQSRHEVGVILQSGTVPCTILRAAMILGSGSASFEILRYLVERLPVMITPNWVFTPCQPIAIRNVLNYLVGCLEHPETNGQIYDIGGPEVLNYRQIMDIYAKAAGLTKRWVIPVPFFTPSLSAYWIHLVTPVPSSIAIPLAQGLSTPVVCKENRIRTIVPQELLSCRESIQLALERLAQDRMDTCWMDAGPLLPPEWAYCGDAEYAGGTVMQCGFRVVLKASLDQVWAPISRIGGKNGWYYASFLWQVRGLMDRLSGGVGLRRGRRSASRLYTGDALDFWRVLEIDAPHRLTLLAEMKTPGDAILEILLTPQPNGLTLLQLLSRFMPKGLMGILYWYLLYPFHEMIFSGMLRAIAKAVDQPIVSGPERFTLRIS
ncbi:MAG: SDR family oxidoreductase [Deltaproteobacteria bacterium]|nr:SDR family oxidoreductase [Deltaproteobacteria bacterium]